MEITEKKKKSIKKVYRVTSSILAGILILVATGLVILYANGYRFDRDGGVIEKTGVLTIKSNPSRADVKLDGILEGKTTKTFASLYGDTDYTIEISKEGYHQWSKTLKIVPERSTPLESYLFKNNLKPIESIKIDDELLSIQASPDQRDIFTLTVSEKITNDEDSDTTEDGKLKIYRLWRYSTSPHFWENNRNPRLLIEQELEVDSKIGVLTSPNGEQVLLTIQNTIAESIESYLLDTNVQTNTLESINLKNFHDTHRISWAEDSKYLILESDSEVISMNIKDERKILLANFPDDSDQSIVWNTDEKSNFYNVEYVTDENDLQYAKILQQNLSGSKTTILVDNIYSFDSNKFISDEELTAEFQAPFKTSPENTRFAGKINELRIQNETESIVIGTEYGLYWYDMNLEEYRIASNQPSQYISTNPNSTKFMFTTSSALNIFTFDKEEEDHTEDVGTITLLSGEEYTNSSSYIWHGNSKYIFFNSDFDGIRVIDDEGDNKILLLPGATSFYATDPSGENLFELATEISETTEINEDEEKTSLNILQKFNIH